MNWRVRKVAGSWNLRLMLAGITFLAAVAGPPATRAQSPGIHIAGATSSAPLQLSRGCDQIVADSPNGAAVAGIAALVSPPSAVVSIWRFNNVAQAFRVGYFADTAAPTDFRATSAGAAGRSTEAYFVCVNQAATLVSG
jgi:hypothetical protein